MRGRLVTGVVPVSVRDWAVGALTGAVGLATVGLGDEMP